MQICDEGSSWLLAGFFDQEEWELSTRVSLEQCAYLCPCSLVLVLMPIVALQLYADNLKCVQSDPGAWLETPRTTTRQVRLEGQDATPQKIRLGILTPLYGIQASAWKGCGN